jgi:hypothetical protein
VSDDPLTEALRSFRFSAFRLETRQEYAVGEEAGRLAAFREHKPRPDRSVATSDYLRSVARATLEGRPWTRVHVLDHPLTEYLRYQMVGYRESAAAGERIFITDRAGHAELDPLREDFWLFDEGQPTQHALLLDYSPDGEYTGSRQVPEAEIGLLRAAKAAALRHAVPLNVYLAEMENARAV